MQRIANLGLSDAIKATGFRRTLRACALTAALGAGGCSSVVPADAPHVQPRVQTLRQATAPERPVDDAAGVAPGAAAPLDERAGLLEVLAGIRRDFGTTLTPRQLAERLNTRAVSSEALGGWLFEPADAPFEIEANAMSIDSPIDWVRVRMRAELAIQLGDLTKLFSNEYSVLRGGAESVEVEFRSSRRMSVAAELRNEPSRYIATAPVVSVQLRRPNYNPTVARLVPQEQ